jgi:hypothetical protein
MAQTFTASWKIENKQLVTGDFAAGTTTTQKIDELTETSCIISSLTNKTSITLKPE